MLQTKKDFILGALSVANGVSLTPLQIQKYLFLVDKNVGDELGHFLNFVPYHYGPFDKSIYNVLDDLAESRLVEIESGLGLRWRRYRVTTKGLETGNNLVKEFRPKIVIYLSQLLNYVTSLSFADLVSAIYKQYPDMKVNSVFKE